MLKKLLTLIIALTLTHALKGSCPADLPVSCSREARQSPADSCCVEKNGLLLLTQFWDWHYSPYEGHEDMWTLHGLWPDRCDGSYPQFCDNSMQLHNITSSLLAAGETDLYQAMSTVWLDNRGHNEHFWQHEWNKHGSCYSTLKPACQADSSESGSENVDTMIDYFSRILNTYNRFPTYEFLANRGITPSSTHTYKLADIKHALKEAFGYAPTIKCDGGGNKVHEVWYSFNLEGPLVSGTLLPREQVSADSCSQDVYYLPKHQSRNKHSASAIPWV